MKKILIAVLTAAVLTSCGTAKQTISETSDRLIIPSVVSYQKYAEEGFLITPFEYTSEYKAVGEMEIVIIPAKVEIQEVKKEEYAWRTEVSKTTSIVQEDITMQDVVDIAVAKAKELGANAITGFKIETKYIHPKEVYPLSTDDDIYYIVHGFCIVR